LEPDVKPVKNASRLKTGEREGEGMGLTSQHTDELHVLLELNLSELPKGEDLLA